MSVKYLVVLACSILVPFASFAQSKISVKTDSPAPVDDFHVFFDRPISPTAPDDLLMNPPDPPGTIEGGLIDGGTQLVFTFPAMTAGQVATLEGKGWYYAHIPAARLPAVTRPIVTKICWSIGGVCVDPEPLLSYEFRSADGTTRTTGFLTLDQHKDRDRYLVAAPEPAVWIQMILGFGLVGGIMRRTRRISAPTSS